jgi:hypothetical protein
MKKLIYSLLFSVFAFCGNLLSQEETDSKKFTILSEKDIEKSILFNIENSLPKYENLYKQYQCRIINNEQDLSNTQIFKLLKTNKNIFEVYFENQILFFFIDYEPNNKTFQEVERSLKFERCFIEKASIMNCKIDEK